MPNLLQRQQDTHSLTYRLNAPWEQMPHPAMKPLKIAGIVVGTALAGLGMAMAFTNPTQSDYEAYATQKLTVFLDQQVCPEVPALFGLRKQCKTLVTSEQGKIQQIITNSTERQDFVVFSIYRTEFSARSLSSQPLPFIGGALPTYQFETIGVLNQFYIYSSPESLRR